MQKSVLFIDDEPEMLFILEEAFKGDGYTVYSANTAEEGIKCFIDNSPGIIISDIMMPGMDGFEMVTAIRMTDTLVPIILLTGKTTAEDAVKGLSCGANDYIRKPFSVLEVVAKANAFLKFSRQRNNIKDDKTLKIGKFTYDSISRVLKGGPEDITLTSKEGAILEMLARKTNELIKTADILSSVWGNTSYYTNRSMHVHISKIKKYLADDPNIKIINDRSIGYKLVEHNS